MQFPEEKTVWYIQRCVSKASVAGVWQRARAIKGGLERQAQTDQLTKGLASEVKECKF